MPEKATDTLADIQQHYAWVIAITGILISATIAIVGLWLQKRRAQKVFSYRIVTNTLLVRRRHDAPEDLKFFYKGKEVERLRLVEILFTNSGAKELTEKDFDNPIKIEFMNENQNTSNHPKYAEIYEPEVINKHPKGFDPKIEPQPESDGKPPFIKLIPTAMNPGDCFTVKVLVPCAEPVKVHVEGHIVGALMREYEPSFPIGMFRGAWPGLAAIGIVLALLLAFFPEPSFGVGERILIWIGSMSILVIGFAGGIYVIWRGSQIAGKQIEKQITDIIGD